MAVAEDLAYVVNDIYAQLQAHVTNEAWHNIGAAGEPAFQNLWVNNGGGYQVARYRKERGRVYVEGSIKTGGVNTVAFTLPVGYRPTATLQRAIRGTDATADHPSAAEIATTGTVTILVFTGGAGASVISTLGFDFPTD